MPKIQEINRISGKINSLNLPQKVMQLIGWKKGDEIDCVAVEVQGKHQLILKKKE